MDYKIRILHLWTCQTEAEMLVRELARAGLPFEAKLVGTLSEYVAALVRSKFDIILADDRAVPPHAGPDQLSLFEITREISPGTPFIMLCGSSDEPREGSGANLSHCLNRHDLSRIGERVRKALNPS
ncbi:MAG: hypothetical protein AB9866_03660 [Syntrophobacteraceae bacterium]